MILTYKHIDDIYDTDDNCIKMDMSFNFFMTESFEDRYSRDILKS